jgi:hypothetical protein
MINLKKTNRQIKQLLTNSNFSTKIYLYFSTKTIGDDYDEYEKHYTYTNLNPLVVRAYVSDIKPEALVWKQYGLQEQGAKEILCEERYAKWFRLANKITIDDDQYVIYKEGMASKALITKRPLGLVKIVLFRGQAD